MKVLELQDIHVHPKWIKESIAQMDRVVEVARSQKVDAITIAGDFLHSAIMANDKSAWAHVLWIARKLQKAAPVYFITGTPSHDSPGCYESFKDIGWKEITIGRHEIIGDLLIMGIPEITPAMIIAQSPDLTKTEAIAKQYELVESVIEKYYSPLALSHNGPVHFMGHGHVAGVKFRDDQKPRSSDFMYSEQLLAKIGADRYQFGHIHLPQEFETINGGYGGSAHITWNDLNFKPGFNVTTYIDGAVRTGRFYYGEPERQKLVIKDFCEYADILSEIRRGANLWLDIECDKSFSEQFDHKKQLQDLYAFGIGLKSKVTTNIQRTENVRVETEEYEKCKTLEDIYKIFDSEVNASTLLKVREAEEATKSENEASERREFEFLDLYLKGSIAGRENGVDEIRLDFNDFQTGANLLIGENGTGKSFCLGFATPFSSHLPKEDNFKDLFELKDSQIVRRWRDGEKIITQKILIDPTLANPSAKFYMDIDGVALNVDGNKKSFDDIVSDYFGSVKMFMTCAFRGQKENSNFPSLENAKESDLRKIYTDLSGADRTPLKNYAHEKSLSILRNIELDLKEVETLESTIENKDELSEQKSRIAGNVKTKEIDLISYRDTLKEFETEKDAIDTVLTKNQSIRENIDTLKIDASELSWAIIDSKLEQSRISETIKKAPEYRESLKDLKLKKAELDIVSKDYFELGQIYTKSVESWSKEKDLKLRDRDTIKSEADSLNLKISTEKKEISGIDHKIEMFEASTKNLNKPCEHCNKISSSSESEIAKNNKEIETLKNDRTARIVKIEDLNEKVKGYRSAWAEIEIEDQPEQPEKMISMLNKINSFDKTLLGQISTIEADLLGIESAERKLSDLSSSRKNQEKSLSDIESKIETLKATIKDVDFSRITLLNGKIAEIQSLISSITSEIGSNGAEIKALQDRIEKVDTIINRIDSIKLSTSEQQTSASEWKRIEEAFSPKGIPALELSMLAPKIDRIANKLLSAYGTRFSVETITQDFDSKGKTLLEKFKILVHDTYSSKVKNLPNMSGGQAVWITKALQEAISKAATERTGRNWLYSIMDEADAALDSEAIVDFYEMVNLAMDGQRKLVAVSHSIEAKSSISNIVEITKSFIGYGE